MSLQMMEKIRGHSLISYEVSSYIYQLLLSGITLDKCIFSMLQPKGKGVVEWKLLNSTHGLRSSHCQRRWWSAPASWTSWRKPLKPFPSHPLKGITQVSCTVLFWHSVLFMVLSCFSLQIPLSNEFLYLLKAVSSQDEDMGQFDIQDPLEESTTSLVSSSTSAYSSFPVDVVVYVRVQVRF